jgi:uncharacterized protein
VLAGGQLLGRVDPGRVNGTLVARHVVIEPVAATPSRVTATAATIGEALREAATWVGCTGIAVDRVTPPKAAAAIRAALR